MVVDILLSREIYFEQIVDCNLHSIQNKQDYDRNMHTCMMKTNNYIRPTFTVYLHSTSLTVECT